MAHRHVLSSLAVGLALAAGLLGGCADSGPKPVEPGSGAQPAKTFGNSVIAGRPGIEVLWLVVDDRPISNDAAQTDLSLREAMAPFAANPVAISQAMFDRWAENGLALYSVPVDALEQMRTRLRLSGPAQQQWMGEVTQWSSAINGPSVTDPRSISLDTGIATLPANGNARILLRSWLSPRITTDADGTTRTAAAVSLQLLPQFYRPPTNTKTPNIVVNPDGTPVLTSMIFREEEQGVALTRLTLETVLDGSSALVIVPSRRPGEADQPVSEPAEESEPVAQGPGIGPKGPRPPRLPTFGDALLTDALTPITSPTRAQSGVLRPSPRVVVVLIPHAPDSFSVLGR